jgi:hypothetical protein
MTISVSPEVEAKAQQIPDFSARLERFINDQFDLEQGRRRRPNSEVAAAVEDRAYLATIRRRFAGKISKLIESLGSRAESEDFPLWTQQVLESLQESIRQLSAADELSSPEHEGNSCEILRQVRDTLLDCGWKKYREPQVRMAVVKILQGLASADEVTAENAFDSMNQLLELGLNPSAGMAWDDEQEVPS